MLLTIVRRISFSPSRQVCACVWSENVVSEVPRDCAKLPKFGGYKVQDARVATSRSTRPLDYPPVKLRLLVRVVGCKRGDLGQSSADHFDYDDNLLLPPSFATSSYFLADSSAQRK